MSKRLFFADYSDVMQQNFTDLKDIHTFAKICACTLHMTATLPVSTALQKKESTTEDVL